MFLVVDHFAVAAGHSANSNFASGFEADNFVCNFADNLNGNSADNLAD